MYKQVQEFYSYGFGVSEIIFDKKTGTTKELYQIPAETVTIKQEFNKDGIYSYYAIPEIVGKPAVKMKLSRFEYDDEDDDILTYFSIPKVRLMMDDVTEFMNSNKTYTIYEIYTNNLEK